MDNGLWECSVCTYKNRSEAFKCQICDTRKGTSTRKPRVTPSIVAQQIASSFPPIPPFLTNNTKYTKVANRKRKSSLNQNKFKNIDRSSGEELEITVDGVTIVITDYAIDCKAETGDQTYEKESKRTPGEVESSSSER